MPTVQSIVFTANEVWGTYIERTPLYRVPTPLEAAIHWDNGSIERGPAKWLSSGANRDVLDYQAGPFVFKLQCVTHSGNPNGDEWSNRTALTGLAGLVPACYGCCIAEIGGRMFSVLVVEKCECTLDGRFCELRLSPLTRVSLTYAIELVIEVRDVVYFAVKKFGVKVNP